MTKEAKAGLPAEHAAALGEDWDTDSCRGYACCRTHQIALRRTLDDAYAVTWVDPQGVIRNARFETFDAALVAVRLAAVTPRSTSDWFKRTFTG